MVNLITSLFTRLKTIGTFQDRSQDSLRNFDSMNLPEISGIPNYSAEELAEMGALTSIFNHSKLVKAKWNSEIGRLEFTSELGKKFWFAATDDACQHLAALASFDETRFRACVQKDGRVSLTGWCEEWYYSTMTSALTLAKW